VNKKSMISKDLLIVLILVVVSFGIYANSLQGDFVWDDTTLFIEHADLWKWSNLKHLLTAQDNLFGKNDNAFYRPLPNLTFLLDRTIWGQNPFGYHLTNIVFHVLTTITVFLIAGELFGSLYAGIVAGLLFAIHPIHTEVVAWVNGRNNAISGLFYLLAFYFYIRYRNRNEIGMFLLSLLSFACSLFSKEYALTFPLIMWVYEVSYFPENSLIKKHLKRLGALWLPYLLIIAGYVLIRFLVLPVHGAINMRLETLWFRILTVPKIVLFYLKLLLLPAGQNILHNVSVIRNPITLEFLFQMILLSVLMFLWGWSHKKSKGAFFCLGWILVTLLPVLNIIPLSYVISFLADRYLYLPSAGFCMLLALGFTRVLDLTRMKSSRAWRCLAVFPLLVALEVYGFETIKRNVVWRNELTLWQHTVEQSPRDFRARCNLSIALHAAGRMEDALREANEAVRLNPDHDTPYFIQGQILFDTGMLDQSLTALHKALQINPNHTDALNLSGSIHFRTGRFDEAIRLLKRSIQTSPMRFKSYYMLARIYEAKGDSEKALEFYAASRRYAHTPHQEEAAQKKIRTFEKK